jgi:dolichyl-phosphate beta-glucosyltransferase
MSKAPYELTVIVPAYNEHRYIARTVNTIIDFLTTKFTTFEVIIVDDGSSDATGSVIEDLNLKLPESCGLQVLVNEKNSGKGYSIRRGALASHGEVVLFTDADLSYDLEAITLMFESIHNGADLAIGSRMAAGAEIHTDVPMVRSITGRAFNLLVQLFLFNGILDTQCGIKGFSRNVVMDIFPLQTINNFGFDVELLYIARLRNYNIEQIPVKLINYRKESRVSVWNDSWRMMWDVVRIRKRGKRGDYNKVKN